MNIYELLPKVSPEPWMYEERCGSHPSNAKNGGWGRSGIWSGDALVTGDEIGWDGGWDQPSDADMAILLHCRNNFMQALEALKHAQRELDSAGVSGPHFREVIAELEEVKE